MSLVDDLRLNEQDTSSDM